MAESKSPHEMEHLTEYMENMQISRETSIAEDDCNYTVAEYTADYTAADYEYTDDDFDIGADDDFDIGADIITDCMSHILSCALADMSKEDVSTILARVIASMPEDSTQYMIADEFIKTLNEMKIND
jgi:hypothetical protein